MTIKELSILKNIKVRQIIGDNLEATPSVFALKNRHEAAATMATQLKYLQRSRTKLPTFYAAQALIPPLAFEQCSSERAASAKDFSGKTCLDLTCGLGVDSLHFSTRFQQVTAIERNFELSEAVRFNFSLMNVQNVEIINADANNYVHNYIGEPFDLIYLDPARRDGGGKKMFLPEDCEPNFVELWPVLRKIGRKIVVKMSPMYDVDAAFRQFAEVSEVGVISIDNECKEVLLIFDNKDLIKENKALTNSDRVLISNDKTLNTQLNTPLKSSVFVKCFFKNQFLIFKNNNDFNKINNENKMLDYSLTQNLSNNHQLNGELNKALQLNLEERKLLKLELKTVLFGELNTPLNYIVEPDVAFYKARFLEQIPPQYLDEKNTVLTASNGFLLTSIVKNFFDFPARIFRIEAVFLYQPKRILAHLKTEKITALNVVQRNFPFSAADIRTALRVQEGGDWFLICTVFQGDKWVWLAKRYV